MTERLAVYVEVGAKRTFAGAIDWPGWTRAGKDEPEAIDTLLAYADRYAAALASGGIGGFPVDRGDDLVPAVVERVAGGSGTDFGVPSQPTSRDAGPTDVADARRLVAILEAAWGAFDAAVGTASGHELRLGPRGGGRDLRKIVAHVRDADQAYLRQLGVRVPRPRDAEEDGVDDAVRRRASEVVVSLAAGQPLEDANEVTRPWTPRTYVRRAAWHALDHAWEIEDRRLP
jgi:hypothetical protein